MRQAHKSGKVALLNNDKLSGLDCVLPVVDANDQLLLALRRLGVGKGELRCRGVPNAAVLVLVAELHQVLHGHSKSSPWCIPNPTPSRSESQGLSDERFVHFGFGILAIIPWILTCSLLGACSLRFARAPGSSLEVNGWGSVATQESFEF